MGELKVALDRLRTYIYLRDVHPVEWFHDFDRLNVGKITEAQFRRAFDTNRFPFRTGEFELIADAYRESDGSINYRRFCDTIQNIYTNIALERNPQGRVKDSGKVVSRTLNRVAANEDVQFGRLLAKMAHQVVTRGAHVREAYTDFDHHNTGAVTQTQFMRAMPFRDLSAAEMQILVKRYADPILRDIQYRRLHNDINDYIRIENLKNNPAARSNPLQELLPHQRDSIKLRQFNRPQDTIVENFAKHVYEKRIRIREFFEQHDPLRQGLITVDKFEGVLTQFGYFWTQEDFNHLSELYRTTHNFTEYIKWHEFVNDIEHLADFSHAQTAARETRVPSPEAGGILDRISSQIVRMRINIVPTIQDFDRFGRGYITKLQLHRALSALGINVTNAEMDVLAKLYEYEDRGCDFYKFIEDVDPTHAQTRRSFKPIGTTRQSIEEVWGHTPTGDRFVTGDEADQMIYDSHKGLIPKINEQNGISALLVDMKRWSFVNSVHFHDFLEDFDRLRLNEITANQFRSGIAKSTYHLTDSEYEALISHYRSPTRPGWVQWRRFADDIMQVIAPKTLEAEPQVTPLRPEETIYREIAPPQPAADVDRIIDNIARFVKSRRIFLPEQFKQKDKMNHRRVSATGFAQVLHLIGVFITKPQIDRLCQFYNDPQNNFVDYTRFIADVDAKVGLLFGDRAANSLVAQPIPSYGFSNSTYLVQQAPLSPDDLEWRGVLGRLSAFLFRRRIRLYEFFEGFDPLRHGTVSKQKFRTVCGQAELPLTEEQIEICLRTFAVPGTPDLFNYRTFCAQVNEVFGPTELNKTPLRPRPSRELPQSNPSETVRRLPEAEEIELQAVLTRMKREVIARRINVKEQFWDYDKRPRKSFISMQQFKQCIARLGLATRPREFDVLCDHYSCTDMNDMNYLAFCRDIDPSHSQ
jgi:Ca2+-binding EF-hand superfamily protein